MDNIYQKDSLGNRMKTYENVSKNKLMTRTPVIVRVDGRSFHTYTRGLKKPFDDLFMEAIQATAKYLCENIPGCKLSYQQSDEISLLLTDYETFETQAWFDNQVQKLCSVIASMTTIAFHKAISSRCAHYIDNYYNAWNVSDEERDYVSKLEKIMERNATFDCRVFNLPKEEVTNYFYWRQLDASRNSIQMVGQTNFSQTELECKSCNDIQDMLMQKGINWNDFSIYKKRGSCCIKSDKNETIVEDNIFQGEVIGTKMTIRKKWMIDKEIPIFKGEDRNYIDKLI